MAMTLFVKNLIKKPIGTHVELTVENGASLEKISGVITDNDYTTSVEITASDGNARIVDYSTIKGFLETKKLDSILKELTAGTAVKFSYGSEENKEPTLTGTVGENDGESALEIMTAAGEELVLDYNIVRSLLVLNQKKPAAEKPQPTEAPKAPMPPPVYRPAVDQERPLYQQRPEDNLNQSDNRLKETFDASAKEDRKKLGSIYDKFKYGMKVCDRNKVTEAARQARQTLLYEANQNYLWSKEASLFCGYLLRRANIFDSEAFLVGEHFEEAAVAAWNERKYAEAGAYAILALLEEPENMRNLFVVLASSVIRGKDSSGLGIFSERMPAGMAPLLREVVGEAFSEKGVLLSADHDLSAALKMLESLYPGKAMEAEIKDWLPKDESEPEEPEQEPEKEPAAAVDEHCYGTITRLN